jgi:Clp amino terminal domain, pathogenicity island component
VVDRLLLDEIHRSALGSSPLDRLAAAAVKGAALSAEGDAVVEHFVSEARRAGCSWTEIGEVLGVTKQAVRERFIDRVDVAGRERFMPRLQRCITAAQELARQHGSAQVGPAHLLLALASNEGVAGVILDRLGVTAETLSARLGPLLGDGPASAGMPGESTDLVCALRSASSFALERGHNYVGTEHALFVLATDPGARTRRALELLGVDIADIKRELASSLCIEPKRRRRRRESEFRCSFCGAQNPDMLTRGPGVAICAACARVAAEAVVT